MELRELRTGNNNTSTNCSNIDSIVGGAGSAGELDGICIGSAAGAEGGVQRMPTKADLFMEQLNATNAKKVALLLVLGFVVYHGLLNWNYGE